MSSNDNLSAKSSTQTFSSEQLRTFAFMGVAVACLAITGIVEWASHPAPIEEYGRVGEQFYPDFTDPTVATALEVYAFDVDSAKPLEFKVRQLPTGRWVIPTHHDYPADAQDQLAKTAASIIGITRGALVTRWESDHAQYGVVNPKQDTLSVQDVEGVGKRITLRGDDDAVLADYIIGKKTDDEESQYYVRDPEEDEVYIASLDIDLSTKFADWINTDLLELDSWDVRHVTVNNYKFDELRNQETSREIAALDRKTSSDPWTMEGVNEETEQVNEDAIRETVNAIGDLKIVGVRPKQKGLTPDLKLDRQSLSSQRDVDLLQQDLLTRGFALRPGDDGSQENLRLLAREGELYAATEKGLYYSLYFGRAFAGSQAELEIGGMSLQEGDAKKSEEDGDAEKKQEAGDPDAKEETSDNENTDNGNPGRYVFVRVEFDKKYLGDEPVKPVEPVEPDELKEAANAESQEAKKPNADDEAGAEAKKPAEGEEAKEEPKEDPLVQLRQDYEAAKQKYDSDLREYETSLEEYNKKIEDGKKRAEDLNRRFAEWYYVIPGDSFDKLRLTHRADLVKPKEPEEMEAGDDAKVDPDAPGMEPAGEGVMPTEPTEGADATVEPAKETIEPAKETSEPAKEATEPAKEATEPAKEATEPAKEATEPAKEATEPAKEATEPEKAATEPAKKSEDG